MKKFVILFSSLFMVTGCAELAAFNTKVGEIAGSINQTLGTNSPIKIDDSATSARQIDTLYVRVKREFGFNTREQEMKERGSQEGGSTNIGWIEDAMISSGFIHETTPGVYYHMANTFTYGYLDVTLEKEDKNVLVSWSVKTKDRAKAEEIKRRMLKVLK